MKTRLLLVVALSLWGCGRPCEVVAPVEPEPPPPELVPRWVAVGKPVAGAHRGSVTHTVLADGRVLAAGGRIWAADGTSTLYAGAELFDPATGTWSPTAPLNVARSGHAATRLNDGRVLVTGSGNSAELYDPETGTWRMTAPMIDQRSRHGQVLLADGRVMVAGGNSKTSVEVFDPETETWTQWAPMLQPEGRVQPLPMRDGKVLLLGLFHDELYDPAVGSQPPPPPPPPYQLAEPYHPQAPVDCGFPGSEFGTALPDGSAHLLALKMSVIVDGDEPALCRSLAGPPAIMGGAYLTDSVALADGRIVFIWQSQKASLLDPKTGVFTLLPDRLFERGAADLLPLNDGTLLVANGADLPSEVLVWE